MQYSFLRIAPALALFLAFFSLNPLQAQEAETAEIQLDAQAGFDGHYKGEFWVPVRITAANTGPDIEGRLQIVVGSSTARNRVVYTGPITLPTQSNKQLVLYVHLSNLTRDLTVELLDQRDTLIAAAVTNRLERLAADDLLYASVSSAPDGLARLEDVHGDRSDAAVAILNIDDLPAIAGAWNALDVVVFHDVDTSQLNSGQLASLRSWLSGGGQLVVVGGPGWQKTTAAFADLLPVAVSGTVSLDDLPSFGLKLGVPFRDPGPYLVSEGSLQSGESIYFEDGMPLLARRDYGRGGVFFLALDPNLAPLLDWQGSNLVWAEVATRVPRLPAWAAGAQSSFSAASAVASLPSLALPSVLQMILFLVAYVAVVGPLNYFVLKRARRRELAWVTIPLLVVVFSAFAYLAGFQLKGNDTIVNQMSIAFGQVDSDQVRVQSLLGLYSPRRATYEMGLPAQALVRPFERTFGSLSGSGNIGAVDRGNAVTVSEVRVDVGDVQTFIADSYQPGPSIQGQATLRLRDGSFELEVTIQNNGNVTLETASLLLGTIAVPLGNLPPGSIETQTIKLSASQARATAGSGAGLSFARGPSAPGTSPLAMNYDTLLGSSNYFDDRELFPRWQLLQSIAPEFGSTPLSFPQSTATLVGWTDQSQLDVSLDDAFDSLATTLYFLEIPVTQNVFGGQDVEVPKPLLNWQVLAEGGVFNPAVEDLYLPRGWIEFEFQPWAEFRSMVTTDLEIAVIQRPEIAGQSLPRLQLWDWTQELWVALDDAEWGDTVVPDPAPYIGPGNAVRIRLQNDSSSGVEIKEIYPRLIGDLR